MLEDQPEASGTRRSRLASLPRNTPSADSAPGLSVPRHHHIPARLTSFVGRDRDLDAVQQLLAGRHRLVTLTGFGGVGKTRLALEVAARLLEANPNGVCLVELAPLTDPLLVPRAVATALDLGEAPGRPLDLLLEESLRRRSILLVLDNCEHLVDACADLAERLLRTCPDLQILATGREALGIVGETIWQVPALDLPGDRPTLNSLAACGALRLFAERATDRQPDFALTDESLPTVAAICRQLDGIPLAIELAAAWVPVMTVNELAARLDDRFRLLIDGSRTALPRHRTLRALVDWSYDRLSEEDQATLRRLSVFAGGWTLDAVEGVGCWVSGFGDAPSSPETQNLKPNTLVGLARLVAKSLVQVIARGDSTRYRFLETIRQYAAEKLPATEAEEARRRHAAYYTGLAEAAEAGLLGTDQRLWLARLDDDHDNLRAALRWAVDRGEAETALRLCGGLRRFWWMRGNLSEGTRWLNQALALPGPASEIARARALNGSGALARSRGEYDRATALHTEALALADQAGDRHEAAWATHYLANVAADRGDFPDAEVLYVRSVALFRALGDDWGTARALNNLGIVVRGQGDYDRAATLCVESLAIRRGLGDPWSIAASLDELARVARDRRDVRIAAELGAESLRIFHTLGVKKHIAAGLDVAAWAAGARGQHARAVRLYGAADALRSAIGSPALPSEQTLVSRDLAALRVALGSTRFDESWASGRATAPDDAVDAALAAEPSDASADGEAPAIQPEVLSRRERQVVERITRGASNREIAVRLTISELTAESHVRNILRKLRLTRRGQIAAWAVEHGITGLVPGPSNGTSHP